MHLIKTKKSVQLPLAILGVSILAVFSINQITHADSLGQVFVRFDHMKVSTGTTGTVCAKPASTATEASFIVSFPTGYTLGTAANFTVSTTNLAWPTGGTAWPGITTASNVSGQNVTFASSDLTAGTLYCFNWTNSAAVSVTSTAGSSWLGSVTTRSSVPANIDTAQYATASISDDQILVTATVPPAFSFALSGNTDAIGTVSSTGVTSSPTPRTATVTTNAKNGWLVWAKDASAGLNSATASYTIPSKTPGTNSTLSAGSDGYNTGVTSSHSTGTSVTGTITVDPAFVGGSTGQGGGLDTSLRQIASSNGTASSDVLTLTNNVTVNAATPAAGDYTDTITVIGAGLF